MPGLLDALDDLFASADISANVEIQVGALTAVTDAVEALTSGPPDLADLTDTIGAFPIPSELAALPALAPQLIDLAGGADVDLSAVLAPLLAPLAGIGAGTTLGAMAHLAGCVDVLRRVLSLATGTTPGPSGMPLPAALWRQAGMPPLIGSDLDPEEVAARFAELESMLDALGPRLDGPTLIDLLQRLGSVWPDMRKWPTIPVLSDLAEVAGVAVTWSSMSPAALTAHLDGRLSTIGAVIALPRTHVADPLIAQCTAASTLPTALSAAASELPGLLEGLRRKVTETFVQPSTGELAALERHVVALEAGADALDLDGTPLGRLDRLVADLELALLRAVRAFYPAYGADLVTQRVTALLEGIPAAEPAPLADAVAEIQAIDLGFLTDPLTAVRDGVQEAIDQVRAAFQTVEDGFGAVLEPLADGLDSAIEGAGLDRIQSTLATLPATITEFVDDEIRPAVEPLRAAVAAAVDALSDAAEGFDPASLTQPLEEAITELAALVSSDEVRAVRDQVDEGLRTAVAALEELDFAVAADVSIDLIADLEAAVSAIDPDSIPDAVKPLLAQVVDVVASIDFTAEVSAPAVERVTAAVAEGPRRVLDDLQGAMDDLRVRIEQFKPSVVVGAALDRPFASALSTLERFAPSDLLGAVVEALRGVIDRLAVLDPAAIVAPLVGVHGDLAALVDRLRPSTLLEPVNAEIAAAVERLFEVTGVDEVFDGIDAVLDPLRASLTAAAEARGVLARIADLLAEPGEVDTALANLTAAIVDRFDTADFNALADRFEALAAAVASVTAPALVADIAPALRAAQSAGPALSGPAARTVGELARAFPLDAVAAARSVPSRRRLADLVTRLRSVTDRVDASVHPWSALSNRIDALAPALTARLATYSRLSIIDGRSVFHDCATPPSRPELRASVAAAVSDGLELPVRALFGLFVGVAPHIAGLAAGLGDVVAALSGKLDGIVGAEGIGGVTDAIEEAADLLRELDLSPLTDPLDALWSRIDSAVGALDPAPLAAALQAAADALASLLDVSNLIDPDDVAALDAAYAAALDGLRALSPSAVVGAELDPLYESLLADLLPLLDLPGILRDLLASVGVNLAAEVTAQLQRVEIAFDALLHAIPLATGVSGSVSISGSVSVGSGT